MSQILSQKKGIYIPILVLLAFALFMDTGSSPANGMINNNDGENYIKNVVLEDFENSEDWTALGTCPLGETKARKIPGKPKKLNEGDGGNNVTAYNDPNNEPEYVLGVKTYFKYPGYDRVEIKPPQPINIDGKCREIKGWVLCRGYAHRLFIRVKDYKDRYYMLPAKYLNAEGWQQFQTYIPGYIPQGTYHTMSPIPIKFVSLVVVSGLKEVRGTFYVYFDHLTAYIDQFGQNYDGAEIRDQW